MLGVLALNKEVVLSVGLRAVECLVRCVAYLYSKLTGVGCCRSCWVLVLLLGTGLLLSIEAAGAAVNLIAL